MKTSLLEKTLVTDLDDTDDSMINENLFLSNTDDRALENKPNNDYPPVDINKPSVWGEHLNNKPKPNKQTAVNPIENIVIKKFSKKLFDGCDFKKRNPRKSIVKRKTCDLDCSQSILDGVTNITSNDSNTQEDSAFHDDSNLSISAADSDVLINDTVIISNIPSPKPLSILQKSAGSLNASSKIITLNRKLDEGWLERCNESNSKVTADLDVISPVMKNTKEIESDTDIVYESDNETQDIPLYSTQRIKAQEFSFNGQNNINRDIEIIGNNAIPRRSKKRYNSDEDFDECLKQSKVSKPNDHKTVQLSVKDNRKKVTLESKVSSGKANENFVRLDMKRKIYSRGKKSIKTTTYKKKQWKNRKKELGADCEIVDRISLSKCFKCGDIGHYSKNCLKSKCLNYVKLIIV